MIFNVVIYKTGLIGGSKNTLLFEIKVKLFEISLNH